jgi:hypothetical protein
VIRRVDHQDYIPRDTGGEPIDQTPTLACVRGLVKSEIPTGIQYVRRNGIGNYAIQIGIGRACDAGPGDAQIGGAQDGGFAEIRLSGVFGWEVRRSRGARDVDVSTGVHGGGLNRGLPGRREGRKVELRQHTPWVGPGRRPVGQGVEAEQKEQRKERAHTDSALERQVHGQSIIGLSRVDKCFLLTRSDLVF